MLILLTFKYVYQTFFHYDYLYITPPDYKTNLYARLQNKKLRIYTPYGYIDIVIL